MICHYILFVQDQKLSKDFYVKVLGIEPHLNVPGMTEFKLSDSSILGLMPKIGMKKLLGDRVVLEENQTTSSHSELYLRVSEPDLYFSRALEAGAQEISAIELRNWGNRAGYLKDLDGHLIVFSN